MTSKEFEKQINYYISIISQALANDFYVKVGKNIIKYSELPERDYLGYPLLFFSKNKKEWFIGGECYYGDNNENYVEYWYAISDYGKTWALTDKELDNDRQ